MSSDESDIWYRIGYVLERARHAPDELPRLPELLRPGNPDDSGSEGPPPNPGAGSGDEPPGDAGTEALVRELVTTGARSLAGRILRLWPPRQRASLADLLAAGASGAAAAVLVDLVGPLVRSGSGRSGGEAGLSSGLLEGAGRGLLYGGVVEPRLPGPAFLVGFVYGTGEYLASPWGGLPTLLRSVSPHGKLPFVSRLLEPGEDRDPDYVELVAFGLALALLYDLAHENRGIADEE